MTDHPGPYYLFNSDVLETIGYFDYWTKLSQVDFYLNNLNNKYYMASNEIVAGTTSVASFELYPAVNWS